MTKTTTSTTHRGRALIAISIGLVVIGLATVLVSIGLEWHGFGGGFAVGAGIGAMLVGASCGGWAMAHRRSMPPARWLPSEDTGR